MTAVHKIRNKNRSHLMEKRKSQMMHQKAALNRVMIKMMNKLIEAQMWMIIKPMGMMNYNKIRISKVMIRIRIKTGVDRISKRRNLPARNASINSVITKRFIKS